MGRQNRSVHLIQYPVGVPNVETDFAIVTTEIPDTLQDGEVLFKSLYLSVDPYLRGRMRPNVKSYTPPFQLNQPIEVLTIQEVIDSKHDNYKVGDIYTGSAPVSDYVHYPANAKIELQRAHVKEFGFPIHAALSSLGMVGLTAYFGFVDVCSPKEGETVVVSGAAGAVGTLVGQIAKIYGCKVIGIAGGEHKVKYLKEELGFDATIDYKSTKEITKAVAEVAPNGVDIYFDNVGGDITDQIMPLMNTFGRISKCGAISTYNDIQPAVGPVHDWLIITRSLTIRGWIVTNWSDRFMEGFTKLFEWVKADKLKYPVTIRDGLENWASTFVEMLNGANIGKMLVKSNL